MTRYFQQATPEGGQRFLSLQDDTEPPEGAVELADRDEYDRVIAATRAQADADRAKQLASVTQQAKTDYEALVALSLPAETAARLTGYREAT